MVLLTNCRPLEPRHGWSRQWGPLVPHESFPGDCGICHVPDRWDTMRDDFSFDHAKETGYALDGAHAEAACLRCHNDRGPIQVYLTRGCGGCHPDPHASSMGPECERCHNQDVWEPIGLIAEHARTRFPLMGSHAITPCESCHAGAPAGQFLGAATQCDLCHQEALARAVDPDHAGQGWVVDCQRCHTPIDWAGASVPHDFFALSGGHSGLDCSECHTSDVFTGLSADCYACHSADYLGAQDHDSLSLSQDCTECHSTTAWTPASFDHTSFALTGGHGGLDCTACHTGGTYAGLFSDCYTCHSTDYLNAQDHDSLSLSHDCTECHSTTAWTPASFDHTLFALTGGHGGLDCTACHTGGTYTGLSSDCYTCHSTDYLNAQDHDSLNLSHDCTECHSTTAWTPSSFRHTFPLSDNHDLSCLECHTTGSAAIFSCIDCHEHNKADVDKEHDGDDSKFDGYNYDSQSCYDCHPHG